MKDSDKGSMRLAVNNMKIRGPSLVPTRLKKSRLVALAIACTAISLSLPGIFWLATQSCVAAAEIKPEPATPVSYDMAHRLEVGLHAGYLGIDSMSQDTRYVDSEFDWGGTLRYWFDDRVSAGTAYHRWSHDDDLPDTGLYPGLKGGPGSAGFDEYGRGSFRLILDVWDFSVFYNFPVSGIFRKWRAGFMGGVSFWDANYRYFHDSSVVPVIPGNANSGSRFASLSLAPATQKVAAGIDGHDWADFTVAGSTWGIHVGGGFEYWFDPDFSVKFEGRYNHGHLLMDMAPDLVSGLSDKESLDVSGWYYGVGFSYHFPAPDLVKDQGKEKNEVFPY